MSETSAMLVYPYGRHAAHADRNGAENERSGFSRVLPQVAIVQPTSSRSFRFSQSLPSDRISA